MVFSAAHVCSAMKWFEIPQRSSSPAVAEFDMQQRSGLQAQSVSGKEEEMRRENTLKINGSVVELNRRPFTPYLEASMRSMSRGEEMSGARGHVEWNQNSNNRRPLA